MFSIENSMNLNLNNYDALIIGTPVYHAAPACAVMEYVDSILPLAKPTPAFIYNTRAMMSYNTNRILAKKLQEKNISTVIDREYRSPASDGALLTPFIQRFFEFEKELQEKIIFDCNMFLRLLQESTIKVSVPPLRFSSILNAPNKFIGQLTTFKIYLHHEKCKKCNKCIRNCPHKALYQGKSGYPEWIKKRCENCYRCVHHCPTMALSLSRKRTPKKLLDFSNFTNI